MVNTFGNLLGRSTGKAINPRQVFPSSNTMTRCGSVASRKIESDLRTLSAVCADHYSVGNFFFGIEEIMRITRNVNQLFQETKPWTLVKVASEKDRWEWIIFLTMESLRIMSILLQPIIPLTARRSLDRLGIPESDRSWSHASYREKLTESKLGSDPTPFFRRIK